MLGWQTVAERLVALGLDADVAEAYLRLLMQGPARPAAFSKMQGFSRSGAYRHLERLAELGLANASQDRPVVYEAAEPAILFKVLEGMNASRANAIDQAKSDLESVLAAFPLDAQDGRTFRHLVGRTACNEELHRFLDRAIHEVLMVDTSPSTGCAQPIDLWPRLQRQALAGFRQKVVVADGSVLPSAPAHFPVRKLAAAGVMRFLIVDGQSTFLCITDEEQASGHGPLEECLATSAPGLVEAQLELFARLWAEGTPVARELPATVEYKTPRGGWHRR